MKEPKTIVNKIKFIKKALNKPYHTVNYMANDMCVFIIEDRFGDKLKWTGTFIAAAVGDAMEYVKHEIEMGAVKEPK